MPSPSLIYFNGGTHSICPPEVLARVQAEQVRYESNPTAELIGVYDRLFGVQKRLAEHFGARVEDIALRSNVSEPINEYVLGLKLEARQEVLLPEWEYGAVAAIARYRGVTQGNPVRTLAMPTRSEARTLSPEAWADRVTSQLRPETGLLIVSHIYTGNGLVLPIEQIARETRRRGIALLVDGAHTPGSMPLDLGRMDDVDFYAGNLHKWWQGPKGTAFGWVNPRARERLVPRNAGWTTFEVPEFYGRFSRTDPWAAQNLKPGCLDFSPFLALDAALDLWRSWGTRPMERLTEMGRLLQTTVASELGWKLFDYSEASLRGPLHAFLMPQAWTAYTMMEFQLGLLRTTGVQVSMSTMHGEKYVRLAPGHGLTDKEILEGVSRMKAALAKNVSFK